MLRPAHANSRSSARATISAKPVPMSQRVFFKAAVLAAMMLSVSSCSEHKTVYAVNYSEHKFAEIQTGDTSNRVITLLGEPLRIDHQRFSEQWIYGGASGGRSSDGALFVKRTTISVPKMVVCFGKNGTVKNYYGKEGASLQAKDKNAVRAALGLPTDIKTNEEMFIFNYTEGSAESFDVRAIILDEKGRVIEKKQFYYRD